METRKLFLKPVTCGVKENSLMEVATIQSDNNVAVPQTGVICLKVTDVLKLAFCHIVGTAKETNRGDDKTGLKSTKSADPSDQHQEAP